MTTTPSTDYPTFDAMTERDDFLGFGYLGARRNALDASDPDCPPVPEQVAIVDSLVLAYATEHRWSAERLFTWANSKNGRWLGDHMFGWNGDHDGRFERAIHQGLMSAPRR
jgi:hypothetical protein